MKQKTKFLHWSTIQYMLTALFLNFTICFSTMAQEKSVTGTVKDANGMGLPGVNVIIKGSTTGVVTDINGNFLIKIPNNSAVLVFSFVGLETQEITVGDQSVFNVILQEEVKKMDEVVVIGYGVQKKSDLTGAIASVSSDNLVQNPSSNVSEALQGKAAGVEVMSASGMPGASIMIRIRGLSSINSEGPMFVIDGVSGDINSVNPNDIQSVEVLKDASSQAIYGSAGGNGVVLVTTKQGSFNEKTTATFTAYSGIQDNDPLNVKLCDTKDYLTIWGRINPTKTVPNADTLPNTNWWDAITHKATIEDYNFTISSGSKNSSELFSLGYFNQDGVVKYTNYQRYTMRINTEQKITGKIQVGEDINLSYVGQQGQYDNATYNSVVTNAYEASPVCNIGNAVTGFGLPISPFGQAANPYVYQYYNSGRTTGTYRAAGNVHLTIDLLKNLTYSTRFGGDCNFWEENAFYPEYFLTGDISNSDANVERTLNRDYSFHWQHVFDYKNTFFEDHHVDVMAGFEASGDYQMTLYGKADSLYGQGAMPQFQYLNSTLRTSTIYLPQGTGTESTNYGYFGRFNYDYKNIGFFQFSLRRDGSSTFGPDHVYGTFPAGSVGLKFSELSFVKDNLPFLSFGKIRYGLGRTGNSNLGSNLGTSSNKVYSLIQEQLVSGYAFSGNLTTGAELLAPGNADLHWEDIVTNDVGIDLGFLKNRLNVTLDWFQKKNDGMLAATPLPDIAGRYVPGGGTTNQPYANVGGLLNRGLEFTCEYKDKVGDLNYSIHFNITKILEDKMFNLGKDSIVGAYVNGAYVCISKNGYAPSEFWGYKTDGLYQASDYGTNQGQKVIINQPKRIVNGDTILSQPSLIAGDLKYVDINGDGKINSADIVPIGNPNPDFTYGFSGSVSYKSFDLNFFFQGSYGNKIFNFLKATLYNNNGGANWCEGALNAYRPPVTNAQGVVTDPGNTSATQFILTGKFNNYQNSDWYVEDGSYLRLKSLQIGYTLPTSISKSLKIEKLRIYLGAKNLLTFTKYSGADPEIGSTDPTSLGVDYGVYPQVRSFMGGLELTF